ncbi:unnamed protein product [Lathyrus oleraceus]
MPRRLQIAKFSIEMGFDCGRILKEVEGRTFMPVWFHVNAGLTFPALSLELAAAITLQCDRNSAFVCVSTGGWLCCWSF